MGLKIRNLVWITFIASLPGMTLAEGFCGVEDEQVIRARLAGDWDREGTLSVENAITSYLKPSIGYQVSFGTDGAVNTMLLDNFTGRAQPLVLMDPRAYDVDRVDDMLDTTERFDLADLLSDTRCGPGDLPQLVVTLSQTQGMSASGTITYIAYFDDRVLEISELTLKSDETVLFLTETALLTPAIK